MEGQPMRRTAVIICAAAIATTAAPSQARTIMGIGALPCGRWLEDRKNDDYYASAQWVLGYLSRADRISSHDVLHHIESSAVVTWLDQYCAAHPEHAMEAAAMRLEMDLSGRAKAKPKTTTKTTKAKAQVPPKGKGKAKAHTKGKPKPKPKPAPTPESVAPIVG
jgi:hypothetical protein